MSFTLNHQVVLHVRWPNKSYDTPGGPPSLWTKIPLEVFQKHINGPTFTFHREHCFLGTECVYIPLCLIPTFVAPEVYIQRLKQDDLIVSVICRHELPATIMEEEHSQSNDPLYKVMLSERAKGNRIFAIEKAVDMLRLFRDMDGTEVCT